MGSSPAPRLVSAMEDTRGKRPSGGLFRNPPRSVGNGLDAAHQAPSVSEAERPAGVSENCR